jgi:thiol-disulfide isomerase/thioredoxin
MKTNKLLVTAALGAAITAPIAGFFFGDVNGQPMTSTEVRGPFFHGLPAGLTASPADLASLERADDWLNSPPLTASALRGKVVLVDFWTYTCINWRRTLPYVRAWAEKYKDQGCKIVRTSASTVVHSAACSVPMIPGRTNSLARKSAAPRRAWASSCGVRADRTLMRPV